jgi:hypothetical protein
VPAAPAAAAPVAAPASLADNVHRRAHPVRDLRASCRKDAKAQGLEGDKLHEAVSACVVRARPDLAVSEQCRTEGRTNHLHKAGLRTFVRDCKRART